MWSTFVIISKEPCAQTHISLVFITLIHKTWVYRSYIIHQGFHYHHRRHVNVNTCNCEIHCKANTSSCTLNSDKYHCCVLEEQCYFTYIRSSKVLAKQWFAFCCHCGVISSKSSPVMWTTSSTDFFLYNGFLISWLMCCKRLTLIKLELWKNVTIQCGRW
jgi:hypothetical protein